MGDKLGIEVDNFALSDLPYLSVITGMQDQNKEGEVKVPNSHENKTNGGQKPVDPAHKESDGMKKEEAK